MAKKSNEVTAAEIRLVAKNLGQIANCLAYLVVNSGDLKNKTQGEQIPILASLGFDRNAIAAVLKTTPPTVSVTLSQLKGKSKAKKPLEADMK